MDAFGWVVVRASRDEYATIDIDNVDDLDERLRVLDRAIWRDTRDRLESIEDPWFKWQFFEQLNYAGGYLQFCTSRNHRASDMWDLMDWIAAHAPGAYGLVYVRDEEDLIGVSYHGRGRVDHSNEFRVWRILKGAVEEFADPLLSPIVPTIDPTEYA